MTDAPAGNRTCYRAVPGHARWRSIKSGRVLAAAWRFGLVGLAVVGGLGPSGARAAPLPRQVTPVEAPALIASARATQAATRARLQVLGDAFECGDARFVSYRRSDFEPEFTDQWYVASQMAADAALVQALLPPIALTNDPEVSPLRVSSAVPDDWDPDDARCYVEKRQLLLDRQWDYVNGGFFPRSNPTGTRVLDEIGYGDDNALAGLALLALADSTAESGAPPAVYARRASTGRGLDPAWTRSCGIPRGGCIAGA
jgi:hypothetical protein